MKKQIEEKFLSFIEKEKELTEIRKRHAMAEVLYRADCLDKEEEEENINFVQKAKFHIGYLSDFFKIKFMELKYQFKKMRMTDETRKETYIKEKIYEKNDFLIHITFQRQFYRGALISDHDCIDISDTKYDVYIKIEFNEIYTQELYHQQFEKEKEADAYFLEITNNVHAMTINEILSNAEITMDNTINELNDRITYLNQIIA